ncbi:MAG: Carnitine dehydratase, partial [Actinomycetia bacterium]|nr:Carnitine dehydratase [Actinomycetes bacterium]
MSGSMGALDGVRVVELASAHAALAGKLLGDLGADVTVVEPPGGHSSRAFGPFLDDQPGPEHSLWWWYYNTSKRGVTLDLTSDEGRQSFRDLVAGADIVIEGEPDGHLGGLGLDHEDLRELAPGLIWVSVTPYGRGRNDPARPMTDLTLHAGAGLAWMSGYDDHSLPPVRGGGNQGFHIAAVNAALGALTALLHRDETGVGQHVDVSMHAAVNVTTESGTMFWLVSGDTCTRQTGRHAAPFSTQPVQILAGDGRYVTTGFPPNTQAHYEGVLRWLDELGLRDEFPEAFFLEMAVARGGVDARDMADPEVGAIFTAGREALAFIASKIPAFDFFIGSLQLGLQCGAILSPEEVLEDP